MSRRSSPAAKTARRRPIWEREPGYPVMPPGFCYQASLILAACYPELRYAEGIRVTIARVGPDGREHRIDLEHAWNVHTGTGEVWDSTLRPKARLLAATPMIKALAYQEGASLPPEWQETVAGWRESARIVAEAARGLTWDAKRALIEQIGRELHRQLGSEQAS